MAHLNARCPACGSAWQVSDASAGQTLRCGCGYQFTVSPPSRNTGYCKQCGMKLEPDALSCPRCHTATRPAREAVAIVPQFAAPTLSRPRWLLFAFLCFIIVGTLTALFMPSNGGGGGGGSRGAGATGRLLPGPPSWMLSAANPETRLLPSASGHAASPKTPKEIAQLCMPSVVLLVGQDSQSNQYLGSGFYVEDGIVATNAHVVQPVDMMAGKIINTEDTFDINRVLSLDEEMDLALLEAPPGRATPLPLGDSDAVAIGDPVYAIGNPEGMEGTFSAGIVSAVRKIRGTVMLIQITAPISHGSSGGPVVDANGNVIGIAVAMLKDGQNLNFAIPVSALRELARRRYAKTLDELRQQKSSYGVGASYTGVVSPAFANRDGSYFFDNGDIGRFLSEQAGVISAQMTDGDLTLAEMEGLVDCLGNRLRDDVVARALNNHEYLTGIHYAFRLYKDWCAKAYR